MWQLVRRSRWCVAGTMEEWIFMVGGRLITMDSWGIHEYVGIIRYISLIKWIWVVYGRMGRFFRKPVIEPHLSLPMGIFGRL